MGIEASRLALYKFDGCPFCERVNAALRQLDLEIELRDVRADRARYQELLDATGRGTVPVLRIEGADGSVRWMPESLDIVRFLHEQFGTA